MISQLLAIVSAWLVRLSVRNDAGADQDNADGIIPALPEAEPSEPPPPVAVVPEPATDPAPEPVTRWGAWAGSWALANPETATEFAASIGINRLDIIVNDHSAWRSLRDMDTRKMVRNRVRIDRLADACHARGIQVHLMTWAMPYAEYIDALSEALAPVIRRTGAVSVCVDAEEPWTLAKRSGRLGWGEAAERLTVALRASGANVGVTGIRYASKRKLGPLCALADYGVPQCYATSTSKADPATVVGRGVSRWRKLFGDSLRIVPGLAAYRQTGIKGHTPRSAIIAAADDAIEVHPDDDTAAVYWVLAAIKRSPAVAQAIAFATGARD